VKTAGVSGDGLDEMAEGEYGMEEGAETL